MNKHLITLLTALLLTSAYSCTEIIEPNISGDSITLLAPPDNYQTTISTQQFWWEMMQFADEYQLQIVTPSFVLIERLILDTIIPQDKFTWNLSPGVYQWRVRGINYSYYSNYNTRTLSIDSTSDISQEIIILLEPANNDTTNQQEYFFHWQHLYNADNYNFQVLYEGMMVFSENTGSDTISYSLDDGDGTYTWQVRGQNASSNTLYSSRTIFLDTEPPPTPQPEYPGNNSIVPDSLVTFVWQRGGQNGSSVKDSLFIATDLLMTQLVVQEFLSATIYTDSLGPGTYYWRLKSIDAAGNRSEYSFPWKVIIQ